MRNSSKVRKTAVLAVLALLALSTAVLAGSASPNGREALLEEATRPREPTYLAIVEDAKVSQAQPSANFGLAQYAHVNPKGGARSAYWLMASLEGIRGMISQATLQFYVSSTGENTEGDTFELWHCPNSSFDEETITWLNQPVSTQPEDLAEECILASTLVAGPRISSFTLLEGRLYEFDVTNALRRELLGVDALATFVLLHSQMWQYPAIPDHSHMMQVFTKDYHDWPDVHPRIEVVQ